MEPLNTYFKISPSLLGAVLSTPRSTTSSSFSSPSFADHQTGLKNYRDSPPSLNSPHEIVDDALPEDCVKNFHVVDDNPLFEGFPVLPNGNGKGAKRAAEEPAEEVAAPQTTGQATELQAQLHHLLASVQRALELHSSEGLPDGVAPQLADELEALARKLKEKERELPVGRQLRTRVHAALTGAAVTIHKLRSTPPRSSPATTGGVLWRYSSAYEASPTCTQDAGRGVDRAAGGDGAGGSPAPNHQGSRHERSGVRDSVCKRLLQSPSGVVSPLTMREVPAGVAASPLLGKDDANMVSPKELPGELLHWSHLFKPVPDEAQAAEGAAPATAAQVHGLHGAPAARQEHGGADPLPQGGGQASPQPALYTWMKAALASASKTDNSVASSGWESSSAAQDSGREVLSAPPAATAPEQPPSPEHQQPQHLPSARSDEAAEGLAVAVRAALTSARSPLVYGTPLHRRIQRLLAEQRSPSPMRHASSQAGSLVAAPSTGSQRQLGNDGAETSATHRGEGEGYGCSTGAGAAWERHVPAGGESPWVSTYDTDTTSSCDTPMTAKEGDLAALGYRGAVSPFGVPLRQRYAVRVAATSDSAAACPEQVLGGAGNNDNDVPDCEAADSPACESVRTQRDKEAEASALVAELGLDLSLDLAAAAAEGFSKLEILEHVERWARGQYIAAQRALASAVPAAESCRQSLEGPDCSSGGHPLVDIAIQTEEFAEDAASSRPGRSAAVPPALERRDAAVGTAATPQPRAAEARTHAEASSSFSRELHTSPSWRHAAPPGGAQDGRDDGDDDIRSDVCSPARTDQTAKRSPIRMRLAAAVDTCTKPAPEQPKGDLAEGSKLVPSDAGARRVLADAELSGTPARRGLFQSGPVAGLKQSEHPSEAAGCPAHPEPSTPPRCGAWPAEDVMLTPGAGITAAGRRVAHALACKAHANSGGTHRGEDTEDVDLRTSGSARSADRSARQQQGPSAPSQEAPSPPASDISRTAIAGSPLPAHFARRRSRDNHTRADNDYDEACEVIFTPGNAQQRHSGGGGGGSGKSAAGGGRRVSRIFTGVTRVRFSDSDSDEVRSARTLSSISSVSILETDPECRDGAGARSGAERARQEEEVDAARSAAAAGASVSRDNEGPGVRAGKSRATKAPLPASLRGFFSSLISCAVPRGS